MRKPFEILPVIDFNKAQVKTNNPNISSKQPEDDEIPNDAGKSLIHSQNKVPYEIAADCNDSIEPNEEARALPEKRKLFKNIDTPSKLCILIILTLFCIDIFTYALAFIIKKLTALINPEKIEYFLNLLENTDNIIQITYFALYIASIILFLIWAYRISANKCRLIGWKPDICNYNLLKKKKSITSPAVSVLSFFIPIVNYFIPYISMKEAWYVSNKSYYEDPRYPHIFIQIWWFFFIFGSAAMQVLSKTDERAFEANNLSLYTTSTICGILINLGLTISTLVLLRKITVAQEKAIKSAL